MIYIIFKHTPLSESFLSLKLAQVHITLYLNFIK